MLGIPSLERTPPDRYTAEIQGDLTPSSPIDQRIQQLALNPGLFATVADLIGGIWGVGAVVGLVREDSQARFARARAVIFDPPTPPAVITYRKALPEMIAIAEQWGSPGSWASCARLREKLGNALWLDHVRLDPLRADAPPAPSTFFTLLWTVVTTVSQLGRIPPPVSTPPNAEELKRRWNHEAEVEWIGAYNDYQRAYLNSPSTERAIYQTWMDKLYVKIRDNPDITNEGIEFCKRCRGDQDPLIHQIQARKAALPILKGQPQDQTTFATMDQAYTRAIALTAPSGRRGLTEEQALFRQRSTGISAMASGERALKAAASTRAILEILRKNQWITEADEVVLNQNLAQLREAHNSPYNIRTTTESAYNRLSALIVSRKKGATTGLLRGWFPPGELSQEEVNAINATAIAYLQTSRMLLQSALDTETVCWERLKTIPELSGYGNAIPHLADRLVAVHRQLQLFQVPLPPVSDAHPQTYDSIIASYDTLKTRSREEVQRVKEARGSANAPTAARVDDYKHGLGIDAPAAAAAAAAAGASISAFPLPNPTVPPLVPSAPAAASAAAAAAAAPVDAAASISAFPPLPNPTVQPPSEAELNRQEDDDLGPPLT